MASVACSRQPEVQVIKVQVPANLTAPTPAPCSDNIQTNLDLLNAYLDALSALRACNADKAAIEATYGR